MIGLLRCNRIRTCQVQISYVQRFCIIIWYIISIQFDCNDTRWGCCSCYVIDNHFSNTFARPRAASCPRLTASSYLIPLISDFPLEISQISVIFCINNHTLINVDIIIIPVFSPRGGITISSVFIQQISWIYRVKGTSSNAAGSLRHYCPVPLSIDWCRWHYWQEVSFRLPMKSFICAHGLLLFYLLQRYIFMVTIFSLYCE